MYRISRKTVIWNTLSFLILMGTFATAGLPLWVDLLAAAFFLILAIRVERRNLALLAGSLLLAMIMCEAIFPMLPDKPEIHYRPHEKYYTRVNYQPNVDVNFDVPHGDLVAIDFMAPASIREPRQIRFKTDALGYRNDSDYQEESIILAGDSLVVGNGTDQSETLPNVLRREHGIETYSVAYTSYPPDYCRRVKEFVENVNPNVNALLFIFEGNDFIVPKRVPDAPTLYDRVKIRVITFLGLDYPRLIFNVARQAGWFLYRPKLEPVEVYRVGAHDVGFYGNYVDAVMAEHPQLCMERKDCPPEVISRVKGVFFIPAKYRVYFDLLPDRLGRIVEEPAPGFVIVQRFFAAYKIPVIDLTPALKKKARELLHGEGRYVYWRDDTHWNGAGIRTAAEEVAKFLRQRPIVNLTSSLRPKGQFVGAAR